MAGVVIEGTNKQTAPYTITVSDAQQLQVRSVFASFDGTGSSGAFLACCTFQAPDGKIISRTFPSDAVAKGGVADVSYAPFPGGIGKKPCPPQPNPLGTLIAWYDFADTSTLTLDGSGNIVSVLDKSGNGHDATQATAARRPAVTTINGLDAAHFTGNHTASLTLQSAPFHHDAPIAWFIVCTIDNAPTPPENPKWFEAGDTLTGNTTFEFFYTNGFPHFQVDANALINHQLGPFTQQQYTGQTNPSPLYRLNGADVSSGSLGNGGMGGIAIGGENSPNIDGLTGAVCELIFYVGSLTLTQVTGIEAYLKGKWGTP